MYDSRLGRWLTTDPARQYWSPYLGMGNRPMSSIDPDGRTDGTIDDPHILMDNLVITADRMSPKMDFTSIPPYTMDLPKMTFSEQFKDLLELSTDFLDNAFGISAMMIGGKLNSSYFDYERMRPHTKYFVKTPTTQKFNFLTKSYKIIGKVATPLSVLTTGYSVAKAVTQYNSGGWSSVEKWNFTDGVVGTIGLSFTGLVYAGLITNPIGISVAGTGFLIYGGVRLGMDTYKYFNKP